MEEKHLNLDDALKINKGDLVKVRDCWNTRNLSKIITNPIVPKREYKVNKIGIGYIDNKKVILFYIEEHAYSHFWFSSYRKK